MGRKTNLTEVLWILASLLFGDQSQGRTITVGPDPSCEFASIQPAIDAAGSGDTVVVADGTYRGPDNRDIDFQGKPITVTSMNGPAHCRIDCLGQGRGFLFHSGEHANSVLNGFTILSGAAGLGGGACCVEASSPTISNCVFLGNEATRGGGGLYVLRSSPVLAECEFRNNRAARHRAHESAAHRELPACGGAVFSDSGYPVVTHCQLNENVATGSGGAVCSVEGGSKK